GQLVPGKHRPMITLDQYDHAQFLLGRHGKPRSSRHKYAYACVFVCEFCGHPISATHQKKTLKGTGQIRTYDLYYCHYARKYPDKCTQGLYTNALQLDTQILQEIERFTISEELCGWALEIIREQSANEETQGKVLCDRAKGTLDSLRRQRENLTRMRIQEEID